MKKFTITSHDTSFSFDPKDWTPEFIQAMVEQGIKVRVDRSSSALTIKDGHTDAERLKKAQEVAKGLQAGIVPAGGGARHTPEELGFLAALKQKKFSILRIETGELTTSGKKKTKAEPVADALSRYVDERAEEYGIEVNDEVTKIVLDELRSFQSFKLAAGLIKDEVEDDKLAAFAKAAEKAEEAPK